MGRTIGSILIGRTLEEVRDLNSEFNKFSKKFSTYTCRNTFQYISEPLRNDEFELQNEDIVTGYVPEVNFTFNAINEDIYRAFIQIVNTTGFFISYYDYEIGVNVIRKVYMSEKDLQRVQIAPPNSEMEGGGISAYGYIARLIGLNVTFVSKYGYESYQALVDSATYDDRFAYEQFVEEEENYMIYGADLSGTLIDYYVSAEYTRNGKNFSLGSEFSTGEYNKSPRNDDYADYVWYETNGTELYAYVDKKFNYDSEGQLTSIYATKQTYIAKDYE